MKLREGLTKSEVKGPILFGGEELDWPALAAEPDAGRDVYAVTTFAIDGLAPRGQEFAKKYQERFKEPPDLYAASAYDGRGCCSRRCAESGRASRNGCATDSPVLRTSRA